ncbi:hypothetical protein SLEP1_g51515 [Rubroshorea leprosula]|uniref:Uncharacterized protein n=1 Tax=Rubroshorea leprosula TaxID=152421 RepID=A0AAV5M484_9ROSI|nr:hypothetical protein SLEP1_g51515 [Rubroshorea leprosula]
MLVIEPVRSSDPVSGDYTLVNSDPASGDYTLVNSAPASGWFITLAVTYKGDVYFVPVLFSLSSVSRPPFQEAKPRTGKPREVTS